MSIHISQLYRQSLQPYVDPELLEGVDYSRQEPEQGGIVQGSAVNRQCQRKTAFMLLIAALCLFVSVSHHLASNSPPTSAPVMTEAKSSPSN